VIPNKHVKIIGAGRGATIVNIPAGAILWDMNNDTDLALDDFTVQGNDSVGREFLDTSDAVLAAKRIKITKVEVLDTETIFKVGASGYPGIYVLNCNFDVRGTTGRLWKGGAGFLSMTASSAFGASMGGIEGDPDCYFVNSFFHLQGGAALGTLLASACYFLNIGGAGIVIGAGGAQVSACYSNGSTTRHFDFASTAARSQMVGCEFAGWSQEAIRTASSAGLRVDGCGGCKVVDTGSGTHRQDGTGIGGSTSVAEGVGKANADTAAVGNITTGEDNLIIYSLPARALDKINSGVRITNWGIAASNANAKTLKCTLDRKLFSPEPSRSERTICGKLSLRFSEPDQTRKNGYPSSLPGHRTLARRYCGSKAALPPKRTRPR